MTEGTTGGLGERLRAVREERRVSQTQLAGPDLSPSYLSLIESGKRTPSDAVLEKLATRLDVSAHFLRYGSAAPEERVPELELEHARHAMVTGDLAEAATRARAVLAARGAPRRLHDEAVLVLCRALERTGDLEGALVSLLPLHRRALTGDAAVGVSQTGILLLHCLTQSGDLNQAADAGAEAVAASTRLGSGGTDEHLRLAATLVGVHMERGDLLYAQHLAEEMLQDAEQVGSRAGQGSLHWNAALIAEENGQIERALHHARRAVAFLSEGPDNRDFFRLKLALASLLLAADPPEVDEAVAALGSIREPLEQLGSEVDLAYWYRIRATAHLRRGEVDEAQEAASAALRALGDTPRLEAGVVRTVLGDTLAARGDHEAAEAEYRRAGDALAMMSASRQAAQAWRDLGDRLMDIGRTDAALEAFQHAFDALGVRGSSTRARTAPVER
ncbi:helix-turn-helix domain-containing protein [Aquipuribacter nitratireducens]|uniref:Helix-turn-helix domain-containing protein n=1 Tax=Aquipuribacter nitratireducens TaxID=650104 RepID=A0ABW0GKC0_9MICO